MDVKIILALIGIGASIITSFVTYLLTRRKYNTEVDSQKIKNMSDTFELYKKVQTETLKSQKELLEATITAQNRTIEALKQKVDDGQKENQDLRQQVSQLQMQMINILGNICLDATCKLRKMNFTSDLRFNDNGPMIKSE